jgi:heavy metal sensor kinase
VKNVSLSLRLTAWFSIVFLVGFVLFGVVMWVQLATSLERGRERTLARRATRLCDLVQEYQNAEPSAFAAQYARFADATPEGNLIQLLRTSGERIFPIQSGAQDFPWPSIDGRGLDAYQQTIQGDRRFLVLTRHTTIGGKAYIIRVAGQLEDNRQLLAMFTTGLVAATPALLLVSALSGYLLSRRAMRPVDRLTESLRSINIGNLQERLPVQNTGYELQRLAVTCNETLARLEAAVDRIHRFTADASHELRSPLSFIRTVAEFGLHNPDLDAESRQGFEEILAETKEASVLLEDMLTLARADAGQTHLHFEQVDISELLQELWEKARPVAEKKQQRLLLTGSFSNSLVIQGDRSAVRRLIWTLIDNAVKYTPDHGSVEIHAEANYKEVRVGITDNGIGIPSNLLPRVFERFFRVDASRGQTEGSGLGLAIAKWIADCHRASLTVESAPGQGSSFRVSFPSR